MPTDEERERGYWRPFGGAPMSDPAPIPHLQRLWWPLLIIPGLVTALVVTLVATDTRGFDFVDSVGEFFFYPCVAAYALTYACLAQGDRFTQVGRLGLSLLAAGLTAAYIVAAFFTWLFAACYGVENCLG